MKSKLSVWTIPYSKTYCLTHPHKFLVYVFKNFRDAWMRCKYGYCYGDIWNWYDWFLNITPPMLRHIVKYGCSYPGREPFETSEKWHEFLANIANLLETGTEEWQNEHNKYYEKYIELIMNNWENDKITSLEESKLKENYFDEEKRLSEESEKNVKEALQNIAEHFYSFWD